MITYKISKDNTPYYVASVEWTGRKWERTTNGSMIMTEDIISDKYGLIISDRRSTAYILLLLKRALNARVRRDRA